MECVCSTRHAGSSLVRPFWFPPADRVPLLSQDDEVVLQCSATVLKEQLKLCLAAEGFGNRLCFLEPTSNAQVCVRPARVEGQCREGRVLTFY